MLEGLGYKIIKPNKGTSEITAIKRDLKTKKETVIKGAIGSNVVSVDGVKIYLKEIVWQVNDMALALIKPVETVALEETVIISKKVIKK